MLRSSLIFLQFLGEAAALADSNKVVVGSARFTVLTDSLIRMEAGQFNDVPSLIFQTREQAPDVEFTTERSAEGGVVITTKHVKLDFHPGANFSGSFTSSNLAVEFNLNATHRGLWSPGMQDTENLKGTLSAMDCYDDPAVCAANARASIGSGLISRAGWVVIDDTKTPLWAEESSDSATSHWSWWQPSHTPPAAVVCKTPAPVPVSKPWKILNSTDWKANNCPNPYAVSSGIEECADMCAARCDCVAVSAFKTSLGSGKAASSCNFKCNSSGAVANNGLDAVIVRPNAERCSEAVAQTAARSDQYLFAHGHRYTDALKDFTIVAGPMDMPPLSAFGIWWSRYWVYSVGVPSIAQDIVTDVLDGYRDHALPLNHLVMDMDWHSRDSQYSWNTTIIPDPAGWMADLHSDSNPLGHPLKYLVNLHPNGVGSTETHYKEFANAMGSHGKGSGSNYNCDLSDPAFASAFFDWMMGSAGPNAAPNNGIDYWWTDWGGCGSPGGSISSLWWANYLYHQDAARTADGKRGLVLSRHGGLGTHRYGVGFSGDAPQHWDTLQVQVEMTSQASNILFGYWSHDVGGFHNGTWMHGFGPFKNRTTGWMDEPGDEDPLDPKANELYLRWLQFATFMPIFRTHCQLEPIPVGNICDPHTNPHCQGCERRIWKFIHHYPRMKDAMVLRNGLAPYIYTAVRKAYDTGIALLRPMYYEFPEAEESYEFQATQYMFGDDMLVAPITEAAPAPVNASLKKAVWLPEGTWTDWHGEKTYVGPLVLNQSYSHADVPVFVRASAVVPLKTMADVASSSPSTIVWVLFPRASMPPSADGRVSGGEMYEDDGETIVAKTEVPGSGRHSAVTSVSWAGSCAAGERLELTISTKGTHRTMIEIRKHALQLRGCKVPPRTATVNGQDIGAATGTFSVGVVPTGNADEAANLTIVEPTGDLGWALSRARTSRSLVTGAEAVHIGLGQHDARALVRVQIEF